MKSSRRTPELLQKIDGYCGRPRSRQKGQHDEQQHRNKKLLRADRRESRSRQPSAEELEHDFIWRRNRRLQERGLPSPRRSLNGQNKVSNPSHGRQGSLYSKAFPKILSHSGAAR